MDSVSAQETFQAACAYMREGSFTQALALFDLILQSYPNHPELLRARAVCLDRLGTIAESERGSDKFSSAFKNPRGITLQTGLSGWRTAVGSPLWGRWALSLLLIGALLVGVASTTFHRRKLEGTKWKMGEYECAFGASSRVHVTYKSQVFPGAYVLEGSRLHVTGQGQIFDGTWDGKELTIDNNKAEYLGSYRESLQAGPAQSLEPGRWHLFMAAQVANGAVLEMCDAFLKHKVPIEWMTLLGQYDDPNESSQARRDMEPLRRTLREGGAMKGLADRHTVSRELERLTRTVGRNDSILLLFASHMSANGMDIGLSFEELDVYVAQLPEQALKVVLLEGCGSGGALDVLKHADILYASTPKTEGSAGGFLDLFTQALRPKFLFSASDVDGNGIVTLGEAFDVASDKSRLAAHYNRSPDGFVNIPQRATRTPGLDYTVSFVPFAVRVYSDPQSIQGN